MGPEQEHQETRRFAYGRSLARLSGIILLLPAAMAAGWLLGFFLVDPYLHTFPWGSIILTLFGAGAGFYEIFRILGPGRNHGECQHK
jgi:F0F1-type ATP synthase assembly protein I